MFVIGDNVKYSKGYYYNRNKIKTPNGELVLTVPLMKNSSNQKLNEVKISYDVNWAKKHLHSINSFYRKADYFDDHIGFFEKVYNNKWDTLLELNTKTLFYLIEQLDIDIPVYFLSSLMKDYVFVNKSQRIVDVCKELKANVYISGIGGKDYIEPNIFENNNIKLEYQNYAPKEYRQLYGDFVPNLSVIDLLFNLGEEARNLL